MTDLNVTFAHPTDGRTIVATLDEDITAQEVVAELIAAEFIEPHSDGYTLTIKGGKTVYPRQSFRDARVDDGATIHILPNILGCIINSQIKVATFQ